jgi:hypothetical protein
MLKVSILFCTDQWKVQYWQRFFIPKNKKAALGRGG